MRLSIVIPVYNEGSHIERIVREIHEELQKVESDFEIVVVDNGSIDDTQAILKALQREMPRARAHRVFPNCGYGGGVLAGLAIARSEIVGWTDGDGQISAGILGEMYEKMRQENLVFLKAKRTVRYDGILRALQSKIYNLIFQALFSTSVSDVNAKPKFFRRSFYEDIGLVSVDFFIDAEIVIKALQSGVPIREHPIIFQSRQGGSSKIGLGAGLEFIKNLLYYRFFKR